MMDYVNNVGYDSSEAQIVFYMQALNEKLVSYLAVSKVDVRANEEEKEKAATAKVETQA